MPGYDTASTIGTAQSSVSGAGFGQPAFWMRYCNPCNNAPFTAEPNVESKSAWDSGAPYIAPITTPPTGDYYNGSAAGQADAQTFVSGILSAWENVTPMQLPSGGVLYCWFDLENNYNLGAGYWSGWANYINGYDWDGNGIYPLYASLYANFCNSTSACTVVAASGFCFAYWPDQPQTDASHASLSNPPTWAPPYGCGHCGYQDISSQIVLWQYAIQGNQYPNEYDVDMDKAPSGVTFPDHCFYLDARP